MKELINLFVLDSNLPGWLFIIIILAVFGFIVVAVILLKKYSPLFKSDEKPKSDEEIAKEEVERLTVPMDEKDNKSLDEVHKAEIETKEVKEEIPNREEAANYESHRATVNGDEDFQKQMEEYSKTHPNEEPVNLGSDDDKEKEKK